MGNLNSAFDREAQQAIKRKEETAELNQHEKWKLSYINYMKSIESVLQNQEKKAFRFNTKVLTPEIYDEMNVDLPLLKDFLSRAEHYHQWIFTPITPIDIKKLKMDLDIYFSAFELGKSPDGKMSRKFDPEQPQIWKTLEEWCAEFNKKTRLFHADCVTYQDGSALIDVKPREKSIFCCFYCYI